MKKILIAVFAIMIVLGTVTTTLADKDAKVQVKIDGKNVDIIKAELILDGKTVKSDVPSIMYQGRTLVPVRFVSEELGAKVEWDEKTETATIKAVDKTIKVKINSAKISINGKEQDMPYGVPAKFMSTSSSTSARTMVPLRFAMEALGATVGWEESTNTALVTSKVNVNIVNELKQIETQMINGKEAIVIKNASAPEIKKFTLSSPDRLVVDLRNTNLNNVGSYIKTDVVKEIRTNQYKGVEYDATEQVSRIVLDISEDYENLRIKTENRGNDIIVYVEGDKKAPVVVPPVVKPETLPEEELPPAVIPPTPPYIQPEDIINSNLIVIDAGHGGSDPGALGNGLVEKELTLKVALKVRDKLEKLGYETLMIRTTDVHLDKDKATDLRARSALANANNAAAYISIHFNAAIPSASGIETYYTSKEGQDRKGFASAIQSELIKSLGLKDRGVKTANWVVTKNTNMLSALTELGFITNVEEAKKIGTDSYLGKCAEAIANGIHKFLSK